MDLKRFGTQAPERELTLLEKAMFDSDGEVDGLGACFFGVPPSWSDEGANPFYNSRYLGDVYDVHYIVDENGRYLGCKVWVAVGETEIWLDTHAQVYMGRNSTEELTVRVSDVAWVDDVSEYWSQTFEAVK